MPTVEINGNSIFFREFGDEANPPIVLLHGLYGDSSGMTAFAELLAGRFRVIAPDALGHGRSAHPREFSLEESGRAIDGLIAHLGYDAAAVMGVSMGSYVAAQAAIAEPSRVSRLVLVVAKAHGTTSSSAAYAKRMGFDLSTAAPDEMLEFMAGALWSPDTPKARRDAIFAEQAAEQVVLSPDERAAVERSLAGFDLRPTLGLVTAPTLVVSGRSDGLNPPESGAEVAAHIPGARFEVYEHSGHMLVAEEPDRLLAEVTAFVLG